MPVDDDEQLRVRARFLSRLVNHIPEQTKTLTLQSEVRSRQSSSALNSAGRRWNAQADPQPFLPIASAPHALWNRTANRQPLPHCWSARSAAASRDTTFIE
jgi:hypothetical protein